MLSIPFHSFRMLIREVERIIGITVEEWEGLQS